MILQNEFSEKTVLITGHTGFKGSWLTAWLKHLGAKVVGVALQPPTDPSHFIVGNLAENIIDLRIDIRNYKELEDIVLLTKPDFVFHLAAQSLVKKSYETPLETWQTNVIGTLNVLEALRVLDKPCSAVIITSDKCYENHEWVWGYRETDVLGGIDPYSASKAAAEIAMHSYIKSFFSNQGSKVRVASARAGNVIGGGDWAANRIVPDCVRAWSDGKFVDLRNPHSTRPWQHVLEPLSGYLSLAIQLSKKAELHGESFNFGPQALKNYSVMDLVSQMSLHWEKVRWNDLSGPLGEKHESGLLKLNCDKSLQFLSWHAVMDFELTIKMTAEWYKSYYKKSETTNLLTVRQIEMYTQIAQKNGLTWAQ